MDSKRDSSSANGEHNASAAANFAAAAAAASAAAAGGANPFALLDPSAFFAAQSLFAGGLANGFNSLPPLPAYGLLGQSSPFVPSSTSSTSSAASLGINSANAAAWWSMASQLAAHDYLARLHAASVARPSPGSAAAAAAAAAAFPGLAGLPLADSLMPNFSPSSTHSKSRSKNTVIRDSLGSAANNSNSNSNTQRSSSISNKLRLAAGSEASAKDAVTGSEAAGRQSKSSQGSRSRKTASAATTAASETPSISMATPSSNSSLNSLSSLAMSYPLFNSPLASLSLPVNATSTPIASESSSMEKKKSSRKSSDKPHSSGHVPKTTTESSNGKGVSVPRSQTVNGKPLALDVSSLIGKPSTSSTSDEAPLNLSMKSKEETLMVDSLAPLSSTPVSGCSSSDEASKKKSSSKSKKSNSSNNSNVDSFPFPQLNLHSPGLTPRPSSRSSRLGRGVSVPKKNTVASLLAQSRSQKGPNSSVDASSSSSTPTSLSLSMQAAMDDLTSAKFSSAFLNGTLIKDSLNPVTDSSSAIQDLLRAANFLGGLGLQETPSRKNKSEENPQENGSGKEIPPSDDSALNSSDSEDSLDSEDGWGENESRKRPANDEGSDERQYKRRRTSFNESALRVPLSVGWRRETVIRSVSKSGVRGDVTYYSPSGRRFRQYPDVVRYLERQGLGSLSRENFSFSSRALVGEFVQPLPEGSSGRNLRLSEAEVRLLIEQIRAARGWKPPSKRLSDEEKEALAKQKEAQRTLQRLEAQEMARQAQEMKLHQRMEKERALQAAKEARRQMREQERIERQEAQRRERELRAQQILEARKKKQEELDRLREEEQQRKLQELNKQRELFYAAEMERERRRQHTAVIKALEARKRYEERERKREEMRAEKRAEKEKRMEERRKELESFRDYRTPTEDMELTDHKPLPAIPRIPNLKIPGQAFADILMVFEFLNTFGETLGFDMESLPSLDSIQRALLYDPEAEEELLSIITHLLVCAIEDPGIPHPNRHTTILGQTLKQADITTTNVSEILRIYLLANGLGDSKNAQENPDNDSEAYKMSEWLKNKPFLALNPTQKAGMLAFLVNELLQNKAVIGQIDSAIEGQNVARRDRWVVDSRIKKLKTLQAKKNRAANSSFSSTTAVHTPIKEEDSTQHEETNQSAPGISITKKREAEDHEDHDEAAEESGAEADETNADASEVQDEDEDESLAADELKKKVERLSRQSANMLTQLAFSDLQLRALNLGQDRYRRRYWVLPHAGGVYLEAMESGESGAGAFGTWDGEDEPLVKKPRWDEEDEPEDPEPQLPVELNPPLEVKTEPEVPQEEQALEKSEVLESEEKSAPKVADKLWFSLLPRVPCDSQSLVFVEETPSAAVKEKSAAVASEIKSEEEQKISEEENKKSEVHPILEPKSRGWWRIVNPDQIKSVLDALHSRGVRERELGRLLLRYADFARESCTKRTEHNSLSAGNPQELSFSESPDQQVRLPGGAAIPDDPESWSRETALRVDLYIMEQIESLEERVASASMQVKGWKLPLRATNEMNLTFRPECEPPTDENDSRVNPIEIAKERLLGLEAAIERRYLKTPLGVVKGELVLSVLSGNHSSDEPTKALLSWRESVRRCETAAQLAICFYLLETSVAWDKSIMKANCQFCQGGDTEDQLLLCDSCDKAYHTFCFRPPMENIPEGDWFCQECINKATGHKNCIICAKPSTAKNWVSCDQCPKAYHLECHQPPLAKVPRGKWLCSSCQVKAPSKRKTPRKTAASRDVPAESDALTCNSQTNAEPEGASPATPSTSTPSPSPRRGNGATQSQRKQALARERELAACKSILDDLEVHDEAWPFLLPVNTKQFPTYRKIIRNPMDLSTVRKKLVDGVYKSRDDFYADVNLIFSNCEMFNEDDSPVGKAGHSMRTFFESRWAELNSNQ